MGAKNQLLINSDKSVTAKQKGGVSAWQLFISCKAVKE